MTKGGTLNAIGHFTIGANNGSGSVLVTGSGSSLTNSGSNSPVLAVGGENGGSGTLTVADGGTVIAQRITLASTAGSTGTLNYGAYNGSDSNVTLNVGAMEFGAGGTLNLNSSSQTAKIASSLGSANLGNGIINSLGKGITTLTGNSSGFSGQVNISRGSTLQFGDGTTSGTALGNATVTNSGTLNFDLNNTGLSTFGGTLSGNGVLNQSGSLLALTGDNSAFTGAVNISSGSTLQLGNGNGSLGLFGSAATVTNGGALNLNFGGNTAVSNQISGSGSVLLNGSGTVTMTGASYTGTTTVNGGGLSLGDTGSLLNSSAVTVQNGGTLLLGSRTSSQVSNVTLNNGTLSLGASSNRASQTINSLTLTGNSSIDFANLASGSTLTIGTLTMGGKTLNVFDWNGQPIYGPASSTGGGNTHLIVDNASTLSGLDLKNIDFYSGNSTTSTFLGQGALGVGNEIVPVPEPGVIISALMLLGWLLVANRDSLLAMLRRRSV